MIDAPPNKSISIIAQWSAPFVRYDNFFSNRPDATPADLATLLTTHPEPLCEARGCAGKECQFKKSRGSWSPVTLVEGGKRKNENVVSVNYFVADLDHMTESSLEAVLASIEGYAAIIYSTHNHAPPDDGDAPITRCEALGVGGRASWHRRGLRPAD